MKFSNHLLSYFCVSDFYCQDIFPFIQVKCHYKNKGISVCSRRLYSEGASLHYLHYYKPIQASICFSSWA